MSSNIGDFLPIKGSVGKNGKNNPDDVSTIQMRLVKWCLFHSLLGSEQVEVDGSCGPKTRRAIGAFQYRFMGNKNPDCRVDPNGATFQALMKNALPPLTSDAEYKKWWDKQQAAQAAEPKVVWNVGKTQEQRNLMTQQFGKEFMEWAIVPPKGIETREFAPLPHRRHAYKTVFAWKSANPRVDNPASPNKAIDVVEMLHDDVAFWQRRSGSYQQAVMFSTAQAAAIRDYRDFVIHRKMSPSVAYLRLVGIGKDVVYQALIGMWQWLGGRGAAPNILSKSVANADKLNPILNFILEKVLDTGTKMQAQPARY